ncbi:MAG: hypothetical protein ACO29O_01875 [Chitinophagaceae bacterium]
MKKSFILYLVILIIVFSACRDSEHSNQEHSKIAKESTNEYVEGDTLNFLEEVPEFNKWINWHLTFDKKFINGNFKSSGVPIHYNEMENVNKPDSNSILKELFIFSPDTSNYLDLYSYSFFKDKENIIPGDADQMIVLGQKGDIFSRRQVMFLGISQVAEFAQWVNDESFLIGLNSRNEAGDSSQYEIFLFNLKEANYINFILDHQIPVISSSYIEADINKRMKIK